MTIHSIYLNAPSATAASCCSAAKRELGAVNPRIDILKSQCHLFRHNLSEYPAPFSKGGAARRRGFGGVCPGPKVCEANFGAFSALRAEKVAEPADKPGSVVDSHSSRRIVTDTLKQPTRT